MKVFKKMYIFIFFVVSTALFFNGCGSTDKIKSVSKTKENAKVRVLTKTLRIESGIKRIFARISFPDDGAKHPAVICSHGYNGIADDFMQDCFFYAQNGFVALAFDFSGGSTRSRSKGNSTDMTLFTEKEDLLTVFDYIKNREDVDSHKIFLMGGSQGGMVTALAAEELQNAVCGLALYYPAFCIPDDWHKSYPTLDKVPPVFDFWGLQLGRGFVEAVHEFNTFDSVGLYNGKVLIIHGDNDQIVPLSYSQTAVEKYKKAELIVLKGEGHGFSPNAAKSAHKSVLDFMNKVLSSEIEIKAAG